MFWVLGVVLLVGVMGNYYRGIFRWTIKPHAYTWLIFSVMNWVSFMIQAGAGGWWWSYIFLLNFFCCFAIFILAFKYGEKNITKSDKLFLALAGLLIVFWLVLDLPVISTILIICIDLLALLPTFRKSYFKPHEENVTMFFVSGVIFLFSIVAVQNYSFLTVWHQLAIIIFDWSLVLFLFIRRDQLKRKCTVAWIIHKNP